MLPWLPALPALIAAGAALGGVFLTNILSRRDRDEERRIKARQEAADYLLIRGEDVYLHLDQLDECVTDHVELIEQYCHGHVDKQTFDARRVERIASLNRLNMARIRLNVAAFFPSLRPLYKAAVENVGHLKTIDGVLADTTKPTSSVIYSAALDAARLRRLVHENGDQLRQAIADILQGTFRARSGMEPGESAAAEL